MRAQHKQQYGFTLIEMIVVIVITGIIAGVVAVFLKAPVQGYIDSARRAELTDIADTAIRRMARDVRTAVPNSVRVASLRQERHAWNFCRPKMADAIVPELAGARAMC